MPFDAWGGRVRRIGIAFSVAAAASAAAIAQQGTGTVPTGTSQAVAPAAAPKHWEIAPLLLVGKDVPDSPGKKVIDTGRLYAVDPETFAVWARVGEWPEVWILLGVRQGRVETIGVENTEGGSSAGKEGVLALARQGPGLGSRLGLSVVGGQGLVYLQEKSAKEVPSGGRNPIYGWDGRGLRRLLGPGDEISFGGTAYRCASVTLGNANASGTVLITIETSQPSKGFGLALHDAKGLRGVVTKDQPVPGRPEARLKDYALSCRAVSIEEAVLADDGTVVLVAYLDDREGTKKGIYAVMENDTRKLIAAGDPCPAEPDSKVRSCQFRVIEAQSATRVVASFSCGGPKSFLWNGKGWIAVNSGPLTVAQAVILTPDAPWVFWQGSSDREEKRGGETLTLHAEGCGLFDGEISRDIRAQGNMPTGYELVPAGGELSGVILQYGWGVQGLEDRFIDARAPEKGHQPVPSYRTLQGPVIPLSDVLAWTAPRSALAAVRPTTQGGERTPAGIYLMTAKQATP